MPITNVLKVSDYINTEKKNKPYKTFNSAYFKFKMGSTCLTLFIVGILNFFLKAKKNVSNMRPHVIHRLGMHKHTVCVHTTVEYNYL